MKPRIAFYAPIKPPDHPIPSGDREIARLMVRALERAGYEVEIASRKIAYQKRPSADLFAERRKSAAAELARLKADWHARAPADRPRLWFTYHPYCKAPDWIGPQMADTFALPYVTAEACRTRQATDADWADARLEVQAAVRRAAVNFCLKQSDFAYLESFQTDPATIRRLPPFIDLDEFDALAATAPEFRFADDAPLLIAVGMMRPGAKTESYLALAASLRRCRALRWNLAIIGDGPAHAEIEAAFDWLEPERLHLTGAIARGEVLAWFRRGDIFAWPGFREAIGLVFLEAQSQGLPVAAFNSLGVPLTVADEQTGLLTPEGDVASYGDALERLITDTALRKRMGTAAAEHVREKHDIRAAAGTLRTALDPLVGRS